jgi:hypothetical protein
MTTPHQDPLTPHEIGDQLDKLWERIKPPIVPGRIPHPRRPSTPPPAPPPT